MQLTQCKLGYGGTQQEMVRLVNDSGILGKEIKNLDGITFDQLIQAIHKIQEQMGITGTTAKEAADTITGSKGSLVAAWNDLMAAVGGADMVDMDTAVKNFEASFSAYMTNFIPALTSTVVSSGTLVTAISEAITDLPTNLLATINSAGLEAATEMVGGVSDVVNWLIESLAEVMRQASIDPSQFGDFAEAVGEFVGSAIKNLVLNFDDIVSSLVSVGVSLASGLLQGLWDGLFGSESGNKIKEINEELENSISDAEIASNRAQAILSYMDELYTKYGDAAAQTDEWKRAEDDLESVLGGSKEVFAQYGTDIEGAIKHLQGMSQELRKLAIQQAMQDKLAAQYKLLGEYSQEKFEAEYSADTKRLEIDSLNDSLLKTVLRYQEIVNASGLYKPGSVEWNAMHVEVNDTETARDFLDMFSTAMEQLYKRDRTPEEMKIWNQQEGILDPEVAKTIDTKVELLNSEIEDAKRTTEEAQKKIDEVSEAIKNTEGAAAKAAEALNTASEATDQNTTEQERARKKAIEGADNVSIAAVAAASAISILGSTADEMSRVFAIASGTTPSPKAVGMDYVPYDGFRATLHKGEAVLTRAENERRGAGVDAAVMEAVLTEAIERSFERVRVDLNGDKVADLTTRRTERNIRGNEYARTRAMGG